MIKNRKIALEKDAIILVASVAVAVVLNYNGTLRALLSAAEDIKFVGNFLAGTFFTSVFTAAPAGVVLGHIAKEAGVVKTAFLGGLGALAGDYLIFRFFKDNLANDVAFALKSSKYSHLKAIFHLRIFSWLAPLLGAIIIASPLSDSLGLALMGLSKTRSFVFIPISFTLHFFGIVAVGLVAKQFV